MHCANIHVRRYLKHVPPPPGTLIGSTLYPLCTFILRINNSVLKYLHFCVQNCCIFCLRHLGLDGLFLCVNSADLIALHARICTYLDPFNRIGNMCIVHSVYFILYFVWATVALSVRTNYLHSNLLREAVANTEAGTHPSWANVCQPFVPAQPSSIHHVLSTGAGGAGLACLGDRIVASQPGIYRPALSSLRGEGAVRFRFPLTTACCR